MAVVELHPEHRVAATMMAFVHLGLRALAERAFQWAVLALLSAMWFCIALIALLGSAAPTRMVAALAAGVLFSLFLIVLAWKESSHGRVAAPGPEAQAS